MNAHTPPFDSLATRHSDMVLDDPRLSLSAKGLFVSIAYLGNKCKLSNLSKHCSDDLNEIKLCLKELVSSGYVKLDADFVSIRSAASFGVSI